MNGQCFLPFVPGIEVCFPDHVSSPSTNHLADDFPNFNLSDVRGVPIPAPLDQVPPRSHIPHFRVISDSPTTTSPQSIPSPSFSSRSSHRLAPTRSLPSYPEHIRFTYPQHGHSLSGSYGRSPVQHYRSASSSPYRSTAQLPQFDQTHLQHRDHNPYGPHVSPQFPPSPPHDPHSAPPQIDKFAQTSARYECTYCGKAFNRPSSLKTHTNTHTGEKRTLCCCNRAFVSLQRVLFSIHLPSPGVRSRVQCTE